MIWHEVLSCYMAASIIMWHGSNYYYVILRHILSGYRSTQLSNDVAGSIAMYFGIRYCYVIWEQVYSSDVAAGIAIWYGSKYHHIIWQQVLPETKEHLELCDGTKFESRGVRVSEVRRMTQKMTWMTATLTSVPEVHLPDAPCGGSPTTLGVSK